MEFSFETERAQSPSSPSGIGSDRLRKAIERNRAKQAKRDGLSAASPRTTASPRTSSSSSASRRSVGSADNVEFTTALRKGTNRSPAPVSYGESRAATPTVVSRTPRKAKAPVKTLTKAKPKKTTRSKSKLLKNTNEYVIKGIWVFCAILLLRLIFSDGGVRDYYAKKDVLQGRFNELARIESENKNLLKEIDLLKKDPFYQKKVVRDHLGYIAKDEYLILFPEQVN